jgi:ABC-type multidrug transport system ATPase subunit
MATSKASVLMRSPAMTGKTQPVLEVISLTKRYGDQPALSDVGFVVKDAEVLGLIGPNGAGKTTLLESIAGLVPVESGGIIWRGQFLPAQRRREVMFYLPDGIRPYGDQFVEQVLAFFAGTYRRSAADVSEIVASVGLRPVLAKRIRSLSKGYNRRLIIALGLITPHPMLLMDEPFDGFDLPPDPGHDGAAAARGIRRPHPPAFDPSIAGRRRRMRPLRPARRRADTWDRHTR